MKPLSRRTVLRGLGRVAIALPYLEAMEARGQAATAPKRFVAVFSPNGCIYPRWAPSPTNALNQTAVLSESLEPTRSAALTDADVTALKAKLLVPLQLDNRAAIVAGVSGHEAGINGLLTGLPIRTSSSFAPGLSLDQHIANVIGGSTKLRSLELGVVVDKNDNLGRISFSGASQQVAPQNDPKAAFDRLFSQLSTGTAPDPALETLRLERKSILDATLASYSSLKAKLGTADAQRLEEHLTSIRALEKELLTPPEPRTELCAKPADPGSLSFMSPANFKRVLELQTEILVMALKCDLTRVATVMWSRAAGLIHHGAWVTRVPIRDNHHALSHATGTPAVDDQMVAITQWYSTQFFLLLKKLDTGLEPNGRTVLDNSVVLWGNELGDASRHQRTNIPFVLAGSAGGYFRTNRVLRFPGVPHNNLLVSCMNAVGVPGSSFGDPSLCTGPLPGLT